MSDRMRHAASVCYEDPDQAYALCQDEMLENPESHAAATLAGVLMCLAGKYGTALALLERASRLNPQRPEAWSNLGTAWHELKRPLKAREAFMRALELKPGDPTFMCHVGATYSEEGRHQDAIKWARRAEKESPDQAASVLCFAELATGDWENGWKHWARTLGTRHRKHQEFAPDWDGSPVKRLIVYGEQGIGDEIMFASCIADCRARAEQIDIECDTRLEGLFRRSFPWATVHGTRRMEREWDTNADAQVACGDLPVFFRPTIESCPKVAYLSPDPERVTMWRALFRSWGKPVIGLSWSGGLRTSQSAKRQVGLESFRTLIESRDAVFVSLQYKDASEEIAETGLPVRQFSATRSDDFDDLAALIYCLDEQIGIHTTAHHVRGALGLPSTVLVPHAPLWNYAHGDRMAWYPSQVYHRQRKDERWTDCIKRLG